MKRTQIQLDERTHETLRRRAFQKGCSMSALVRELLAHSLKTGKAKTRPSIEDFAFIGVGRSRQGRLSPVSERHDEALKEVLMEEHRR
jgi:plasmid stability protein